MNAFALKGLYVTDDLVTESSGIYSSLLATAHELRSAGHRPLVIGGVPSRGCDLSQWAGMAHGFERIGPSTLGQWKGLRLWLQAQSSTELDFVSVHSTWLLANGVVTEWARERKKPMLLTAHGMFNPTALRVSAWKKILARKTVLRRFFEQVKCFQALSEAEYQTLRDSGLTQPICVVGNGLNLPDLATADLAENWCTTTTAQRVLLYVGRLHPIKGLDLLLQAWARRRPNCGWRLVIAGNGDAAYERKLRNIVPGQDVDFVGFVSGSKKDALLRSADALVLPSLSEALPMAALEGWSFGKPVLLTSACNLSAAVAAGAAIEAEPSVSGIASGLEALFSLPAAVRTDMGDRAREFVSREYGWCQIRSQLEIVYAWMCGKAPPPPCVRFD